MSDFARLEEKLGKLRQAAARDKRGRALSGSDAEARLAAALTEFDETILPRRVEFVLGDERLAFAVANRKLHALLSAGVGRPSVKALQGKPLAGKEDPSLDALRDTLLENFAKGGDWRIATARLTQDEAKLTQSGAGVRAATLKSLWTTGATSTEGAAAMNAIQRFVQALQGVGTAWLVIEGEEVAATGGDDAVIDWISERAGGFLDGYYARSDLFGSAEPHALAFTGGHGRAVLYFSAGGQAGFLSLPEDRISDAFALWRKAVAG